MDDDKILADLLNDKDLLNDIDLDEIIAEEPIHIKLPQATFVDFDQVVDVISKSPTTQEPLSEEADLLLKQIRDEVKLESKYGEIEKDELKKFERRLSELGQVKVDKAVIRNKKPVGSVPAAPKLDDFKDETDSWCCICNEDGQVICKECDDDVYCNRCFREGHADNLEFRGHTARTMNSSLIPSSTVNIASSLPTPTDIPASQETFGQHVRDSAQSPNQTEQLGFVLAVSIVAGIFLLMILYFSWYYFYRKRKVNPTSGAELGYPKKKGDRISDTGTLAKLIEKNQSSRSLSSNELSRAISKGSTASLSRGISKSSSSNQSSLTTYTTRPENVRKAFTMSSPRKNSVERPPYARATLSSKRSSDFIPRSSFDYPQTKRNSDTVLATYYGSLTTDSQQRFYRSNTVGEQRPTKLKTSISFESATTSVVNQESTPKKRRSADFTYSPKSGVNAIPTVTIPSFDGVLENSKLKHINKSNAEFNYSPKTGVGFGQLIPEVPHYQPDLQHLEKLRNEGVLDKRNTFSDFQFSPSTGVESLAYKVPEFKMASLNRKRQ
ncbi:Abscission/NoCut checkpoint regulator [Terramyces sp. JEL0728]|nr:Abscission/NoCut checkpoint regulator [Terramyces sp. JEL0728]